MGLHLSRDTIRWYWSADTLFWQLSIDHSIDVQSVFSWAPKLARKCESKHWYACRADGRRSVGRCTITWLPNFQGWVDLLSYGNMSSYMFLIPNLNSWLIHSETLFVYWSRWHAFNYHSLKEVADLKRKAEKKEFKIVCAHAERL